MIANDFFGVAFGVNVSGVDEVAAELQIAVQHLFRFRFAGAEAPILAEGHCAQAEGADAEPAISKRDIMVKWHTFCLLPPYKNRQHAVRQFFRLS